MAEQEKRRRGRPTLDAAARRSSVIKVSITAALREALEMVALEEGRSLSGAIEASLERHFLQEQYFGPNYAARMMARWIGTAFTMAGETARIGRNIAAADPATDNWMADPFLYESACMEVIEILARHRPEGVIYGPKPAALGDRIRGRMLDTYREYFEKVKTREPEEAATPTPDNELGVKAKEVRAKVGTYLSLEIRRVEMRQQVMQFLRETENVLAKAEAEKERREAQGGDTAALEWLIDKIRIDISDARIALNGDLENAWSLPNRMIGEGEHYALEVEGDSMVGDGIFDGDTVIVERTNIAPDGTLVIALINNTEVTLRRIRHETGTVVLEASNEAYPPRRFQPREVSVQGRVVRLMRQVGAATTATDRKAV